MILYDSEEAKPIQDPTIRWVSNQGGVYVDEKDARYANCTHIKCKACSKIIAKNEDFLCSECKTAQELLEFEKRSAVAYTGCPVVLFAPSTDSELHIFWDESDIRDYLDFNNIEPQDLPLVEAVPDNPPEFSIEDHLDEYLDGEDVPTNILQKSKELNALIAQLPQYYYRGYTKICLPKDF